MKKWEQKNRLKNHRLKISQAKTTLKPFLKSRPTTAYHSREIRKDSQYPLYNILKVVGLQQYSRALIDRGFGDEVVRLQLLRQGELARLFEDIKIAPGHKIKMLSLIEYIRNVYNQETATFKKPTHSDNRLLSRPLTQPLYSNKSSRSKKMASVSSGMSLKPYESPRVENVKSSSKGPEGKDRALCKGAQKSKDKLISTKTRALYDDINVMEKVIKGKPTVQMRESKLMSKLSSIQTQPDELLNVKKIRQLYQSMDGGILTSTIINIDIQELCHQFAAKIVTMVHQTPASCLFLPTSHHPTIPDQDGYGYGPLNADRPKHGQSSMNSEQGSSQMGKESDSCFATPLPYKQPQQDFSIGHYEKENKDLAEFLDHPDQESLKSLIRQSCLLSKGIGREAEGLLPEEEVYSEEEESELADSCMPQETLDVHDRKMMFHRAFQSEDPVYSQAPSQAIVHNFVKNLISSAKMQKEAPIIMHIYIKRVLAASKASLTPQNWRKVVFIAGVLASKVWDDQSFENDSFAKVFSQYTTYQINRLQRVFIQFIEYNLRTDGQEFARSYFELRGLKEDKQRCYSLRCLDLRTVLSLQRGSKNLQLISKQKHGKALDKSI